MTELLRVRRHKPVICQISIEALGTAYGCEAGGAPGSAVWPAANRAIFVPFALAGQYPVVKVWWANGAAVAGNVDCGVYSVDGTLLLSAGSTAQAGTSIVQSVTLGTPVLLEAGSYYMALAASSASAQFLRQPNATIAGMQLCGMAQQASALPLPATFTLATVASQYVPFFGIASALVI